MDFSGLTQLSEELHPQSGVDEEEQHEEQAEVPHLDTDRNVHR